MPQSRVILYFISVLYITARKISVAQVYLYKYKVLLRLG